MQLCCQGAGSKGPGLHLDLGDAPRLGQALGRREDPARGTAEQAPAPLHLRTPAALPSLPDPWLSALTRFPGTALGFLLSCSSWRVARNQGAVAVSCTSAAVAMQQWRRSN